MPRIAVDVHPMKGQTLPTMFAGLGLQTSAGFDVAYEAAEKFTKAGGGAVALGRACLFPPLSSDGALVAQP